MKKGSVVAGLTQRKVHLKAGEGSCKKVLHSIRIKQTIGGKNPLSNPQTQWCVRFPKKCPLPNTDTTVNVWAVELQANWFF